jgi:hypothetical protein
MERPLYFKDSKIGGVNVACEAELYFEWNDGDEENKEL